ncbi:hypothetical protein AXY43_22975 [Clostridium sp. MF28]|uniref:hypothetical protein n=1 Tax=Clostridium TaxID=1485 RepID=UPI000CF9B481|nr:MULTISPECIES: hypothetical protein [Clostridium]AVK50646.1 hypothetical protein AXY43_22975 [Clostridium sp. MF28]PSM59025.1 hypothetical protein C4L39_03975 [Clostridium diolis]
MQVNINHNKTTNGFAERTILVDMYEFNEISLSLEDRLQTLEIRLEDYKNSDFEKLKELIPKTEEKIERLKKIIETLKN